MSDKRINERSPGAWEWAIFHPFDGSKLETKEQIKKILCDSVDKSPLIELNGVLVKANGEDVVVCYTGNGPHSYANADFIVLACNSFDVLRAENAALREQLKAARAEALEEALRCFPNSNSDLLLLAGEMSRTELHSVKAVIDAVKRRIRTLAEKDTKPAYTFHDEKQGDRP